MLLVGVNIWFYTRPYWNSISLPTCIKLHLLMIVYTFCTTSLALLNSYPRQFKAIVFFVSSYGRVKLASSSYLCMWVLRENFYSFPANLKYWFNFFLQLLGAVLPFVQGFKWTRLKKKKYIYIYIYNIFFFVGLIL